MVEELLRHGATPSEGMAGACMAERGDMVAFLLEKGAVMDSECKKLAPKWWFDQAVLMRLHDFASSSSS